MAFLIEGIDLCGKSHLLKYLTQCGWSTSQNLIRPNNPFLSETKRLAKIPEQRNDYLEYLLKCIEYDTSDFDLPYNHAHDSSLIIRSIAYSKTFNEPEAVDKLYPKITRFNVFKKVILLTASPEIRLQRLEQRLQIKDCKVSQTDLMVRDNFDHSLIYESNIEFFAKQIGIEVIKFDTELFSPESIFEFIRK